MLTAAGNVVRHSSIDHNLGAHDIAGGKRENRFALARSGMPSCNDEERSLQSCAVRSVNQSVAARYEKQSNAIEVQHWIRFHLIRGLGTIHQCALDRRFDGLRSIRGILSLELCANDATNRSLVRPVL